MKVIKRKTRIPLVNEGKPCPQEIERLRVTKPANILGAPYVSDFVARRIGVRLCELCLMRYKGWHRKEDYRPNWDLPVTSDCHGCGTKQVRCIWFLPEEKFFKILTEEHGRLPSPDRRLYKL